MLHDYRTLFYSQFMKQNDLTFDVGANSGNRLEVFLALGAAVVGIEPQPLCARQLRDMFGTNNKCIIVEQALGRQEGEVEMFICDNHTISSMATDWLERVKASRRFQAAAWDRTITVTVTTLDKLIGQYGLPVFCKIDVEGYEYQVLQGLSQPIPAISLEFTQEHMQPTINCIHYLSGLGSYQFNLSLGESLEMALPDWIGPSEMTRLLQHLYVENAWGDIYARL